MSIRSLRTASAVSALLCIAGQQVSLSQSHFDQCASITGSSATIIVPATLVSSIDGAPLEVGDEIAVFTSSNDCVGVVSWAGDTSVLTIWGDDVTTEEQDGLLEDEAIQFRVWQDATEVEYLEVEVLFSKEETFYRSVGTFRENAIYLLTHLSALSEEDPPEAPQLQSPSDGSDAHPSEVLLTWSSVAEAESYDVQVSTTATFSVIIVEQMTSETNLLVDGLDPGEVYYWRVRSRAEGQSGEFSDAFSFETAPEVLNRAPRFDSSPVLSVEVGKTYRYVIRTSDPDADPVVVEAVQYPGWMQLTAEGNGGELVGTPSAADVGRHDVHLQAEDSRGAGVSQAFTVTVTSPSDVNQAPTVVSAPNVLEVQRGQNLDLDLSTVFSDPDGDPLNYFIEGAVTDVVDVQLTANVLTLTGNARGDASFTVGAEDPAGASASLLLRVTVFGNEAPRPLPDFVSTAEDTPLSINVRANDLDPDGDPLTVNLQSPPVNGTAEIQANRVLYTPVEDFFGDDSLSYTVSDGLGGIASSRVEIIVVPVNDAPRFTSANPILSPIDGTEILVPSGGPSEPVVVVWEPAVDPEDDPITYRWEMGTNESFEPVLASMAIDSSSLTLPVEVLVTALSQTGTLPGGKLPVFHRVTALDGEAESSSASSNLTLVRVSTTGEEVLSGDVGAFALGPIFPNPVNDRATITYELQEQSDVRLVVFDDLGREVAWLENSTRSPGRYSLEFDARHLASGTYFIRIRTKNWSAVERVVKVR